MSKKKLTLTELRKKLSDWDDEYQKAMEPLSEEACAAAGVPWDIADHDMTRTDWWESFYELVTELLARDGEEDPIPEPWTQDQLYRMYQMGYRYLVASVAEPEFRAICVKAASDMCLLKTGVHADVVLTYAVIHKDGSLESFVEVPSNG